MSTKDLDDFLTKEILVNKSVVTYRSLSRAKGIHVNVAKNELHTFISKASSKVYITYLITGETLATSKPSQDSDGDVDMEGGVDEYDGGDEVVEMKILIVGEKEFEHAKQQFSHIQSIHVYCLSPSPLREAEHICTPTRTLRATDGSKDVAFATLMGKCVSKEVKLRKGGKLKHPVVTPVPKKPDPVLPVKSTFKAGNSLATDTKTKAFSDKKASFFASKAPQDKPKATGKLDFSKATPKVVREESKNDKGDYSKNDKETSMSTSKQEGPPRALDQSKRSTKRKPVSAMLSESEEDEVVVPKKETKPSNAKSKRKSVSALISGSEEEAPMQEIKPKATRTKRAMPIWSDDEDSPQKYKGKASMNDAMREVMALMDADEEEVIKASHTEKEDEEESSGSGKETEDMEMENIEEPAVPKKKRQVKKKVDAPPIGSNGKPKKLAKKKRKTKNERGYTVTEDYFEYETDDGTEPPSVPEVKQREEGKGKAKPQETSKASSSKTKLVKAPIKASTKKGGIGAYFGKG